MKEKHLSDGAVAALREDLAEAKDHVPMVLAWNYVSKALDEIEWLRIRELELETRAETAEARVAELAAERESVLARAEEIATVRVESPLEAIDIVDQTIAQVTREKSDAWARVEVLEWELAATKVQFTALTNAPIDITPEQDQAIKAYVAEQNTKMSKDCLVVGKMYRHPLSDRLLKVTGGSYLGGYGRVSNFWHWSYLEDDFSPAAELGEGYGWAAKPVEEPKA